MVSTPSVRIVITPRHRFSLMRTCLEHLLAFTPEPFEALVIAPALPEPVHGELHRFAQAHPAVGVLTIDRFVHPYEAKNLAGAALSPEVEWVVFLDNDVKVHPGWLGHLLRAAEETGANVLHPLYLHETAGRVSIHMAEGAFRPVGVEGAKEPVMMRAGEGLERAAGLVRGESAFVEFHGFMIRRTTLAAAGPFEPFLLSEHLAYSLLLREELGERIVFEPRSVITYVDDPSLEPSDLDYHRFRWDLDRCERSVATLLERWPVTGDYFRRNLEWMRANQARSGRGAIALGDRLRGWLRHRC